MTTLPFELAAMVRNLVVARELMGFVHEPLLAALVNEAFAEMLRQCRETADALGLIDEFEALCAILPTAH